jgi:hypothetical protein
MLACSLFFHGDDCLTDVGVQRFECLDRSVTLAIIT